MAGTEQCGSYSTVFHHNIQFVCNSIENVFEDQDQIYSVSFGHTEDDTLIGDRYEE